MSPHESAAEIRDELAAQTRSLEFAPLPLPTIYGEAFVAPRAVVAVRNAPEGGVRAICAECGKART